MCNVVIMVYFQKLCVFGPGLVSTVAMYTLSNVGITLYTQRMRTDQEDGISFYGDTLGTGK